MRKFIPVAFVLAVLWGQSVSNIHFDNEGTSSVRVLGDVSSTLTEYRVRYSTSPCNSGSGGMVQTNTSVATFSGGFPLFDIAQNISGLAPSTLYYVCLEARNGGGSWSTGAEATFTTNALGDTTPVAPTAVPKTFAAQMGSTLNVMEDCSDLQDQIDAAMPGDTIVVPNPALCTTPLTTPTNPDAISFAPSAVRTSDSRITLTGHPFSENDEVRISTGQPNSACLPGMIIFPMSTPHYGFNCDGGGSPWRKGNRYWVHVVDGDHVQLLDAASGSPVVPGFIQITADAGADTITYKPIWQTPGGYTTGGYTGVPANTIVQFHSTTTLPAGLSLNTNYYLLSACTATPQAVCTTQVSLSSGGAAVNITSTGTGTHKIVDQGVGTLYIAPAPPALGTGLDIVITSDGAIPPAGVRLTTDLGYNQAFKIRQTVVNSGPMFTPGILAHNWRFQGVIFDTDATIEEYETTTDPRPYAALIVTNQDSENILFDRCVVEGPGGLNRIGSNSNGTAAVIMNGRNVGFINDSFLKMTYWHPGIIPGGFNGSFTSTTATISAGTYNGGDFSTTTTDDTVVTIAPGSGVTGSILEYFAMDGTIKVLPPTGVTVSSCITEGPDCDILSPVASPGWPVNANGRVAGGKLAVLTLTAGAITANCTLGPDANGCLTATSYTSVNNNEGTQAINAGIGPGPFILHNNYMEGAGILIHMDDSGGTYANLESVTVTGNEFAVPAYTMFNTMGSDGYRYGHRQTFENKSGKKILMAGNIFHGSYSEVTPACVTYAITPRAGTAITDVNFRDNFVEGCGGLNFITPVDSQPVSPPGQRMHVVNNSFRLRGYDFYVPGLGAPRGWAFEAGYGYEHVLVDRNAVYDSRGVTPQVHFQLRYPAGGVVFRNNIFPLTGDGPMIYNEEVPTSCAGLGNKAFMDCGFTSGPGTPGYTFTGNLLHGTYNNTEMMTGLVMAATIGAAFSGLTNSIVPDQASAADNLAYINFNDPDNYDYSLSPSSPYVAACNSAPCGPDRDAQVVAMGLTTDIVPGNTFTWNAPNSDVCYVQLSSDSWSTWSTVADNGGARSRSVPVNTEVGEGTFDWRQFCSHIQDGTYGQEISYGSGLVLSAPSTPSAVFGVGTNIGPGTVH